ncbi:MAG TPA: carbamoyltransferase HypF [Acidimicrobiales bacterium]|nr:carbamoyltransferase HypF [Acidimicrobiales bacterium]
MESRRRVRVTGTVQGVGFRPFVYREATALSLSGYVRNDSAGVLIEVQGRPDDIAELCRRLVESPPPLARVESVEAVVVPPAAGDARFVIDASVDDGAANAPVSVDTATCEDCLREVDDPRDRRYGYAFTNCTNCGPRFTIVRSVPYDRPATTMAAFRMCAECEREYHDPGDRRFHAQPNACPACGPRLLFVSPGGDELAAGDGALAAAADALRGGSIIAIKGLGGYHLAVDAGNGWAVAELRRRKQRDDKPFALMAGDAAAAAALVELDDEAVAVLTSPRRPIVLAPRRPGATVASGVAPGLPERGVMLPYTAMHHLLVRSVGRPLVVTSGNRSDEPIAHEDDDAVDRLGPIADALLMHDRAIHIRCDDSIVRAGGAAPQVLRRSRGYAPEPIALPFTAGRAVLAVGAELKSTIAVTKGTTVVASHHIGDLEHLPAYRAFLQAVEHLPRLYGVVPEAVAHDLHPEYLSTKFAAELDLPAIGVQHHHAHAAACLVDHGRDGRVLALAFDGHGYGPDGTLWGGEFLLADFEACERVGHLAPVPLLGGSAAVREPWRMAAVWLRHAAGDAAAIDRVGRLDRRVGALLGTGPGTATTSMGRLFDAAAALVVGRARASYEGQAAIELEALARTVPLGGAPALPFEERREGGCLVLDPAPVLRALLAAEGGPAAAAMFHESVGHAAARGAATLAAAHGVGTVALTGGVFQNARLSAIVARALDAQGLEVLVHRRVPPNDGGISIGQAAVAAAQAR